MEMETGDGTYFEQKMEILKERFNEGMDRAAARLQPHMERLIDGLAALNQRLASRRRASR